MMNKAGHLLAGLNGGRCNWTWAMQVSTGGLCPWPSSKVLATSLLEQLGAFLTNLVLGVVCICLSERMSENACVKCMLRTDLNSIIVLVQIGLQKRWTIVFRAGTLLWSHFVTARNLCLFPEGIKKDNGYDLEGTGTTTDQQKGGRGGRTSFGASQRTTRLDNALGS